MKTAARSAVDLSSSESENSKGLDAGLETGAPFFALMSAGEPFEFELTPTVAKLKGALRRSSLGKDDYRRYLEEKFL